MLMAFGASEETFVYADSYLTIYVLGTAFAILSVGLNQFIICQGFSGIGMVTVLIGAALNIALDPVFIFVLNMGVSGAAVATAVSYTHLMRLIRFSRRECRREACCTLI